MANEIDLFRYSVSLPQGSGGGTFHLLLSLFQQTPLGFLQWDPCGDGFPHLGTFKTRTWNWNWKWKAAHQVSSPGTWGWAHPLWMLSNCTSARPGVFSALSTAWGIQKWQEGGFPEVLVKREGFDTVVSSSLNPKWKGLLASTSAGETSPSDLFTFYWPECPGNWINWMPLKC